jgi:PiT family inorganic phosphate transporter
MATSSANPAKESPYTQSILDQKLEKSSAGKWGAIVFGVMLVAGVAYIATHLGADLSVVHSASVFPFILLGIALFIALGFEFVNGFHDTANAVATCIYTHSLEPHIAVVYSGIMNFFGCSPAPAPSPFPLSRSCPSSSS